jgi:hypothetical protein
MALPAALENISKVIKSQPKGKHLPSLFLKPFDIYNDRVFDAWELDFMFSSLL